MSLISNLNSAPPSPNIIKFLISLVAGKSDKSKLKDLITFSCEVKLDISESSIKLPSGM